MKGKVPLIVSLVLLMIMGLLGSSFLVMHFFGSEVLAFLAPSDDAKDFDVRFGILETDSTGREFLSKEVSVLPIKYKDSGFRYGVMIAPPSNHSFTYYCVFHLSASPKVISGEAFETKEPSTTLQESPAQGRGVVMEDFWFDPGDPIGEQSLDIFINGKLARTIHYTTVPGPEN